MSAEGMTKTMYDLWAPLRRLRLVPSPGPATEAHWWRLSSLFWCGVMAVLLVLTTTGAIQAHPSMLHTWDGPLTIALVLIYAAWFLDIMIRRAGAPSKRTHDDVGPVTARRTIHIAIGLAVTVALVVLHGEFTTLIYADASMIAFAIDGPIVVLPMVGLAVLFLYGTGDLRSFSLQRGTGDLIGFVAIVAVVYSLIAVIKQRASRDRLIAELQEAQRRLTISAARDAELATLRERNRLAREMHDSLGHALVLIAVKLEAAQRLQAVDPDRATVQWEETKALVRSTMADLRASLAGLRLPVLDEGSLSAAIHELADATARDTNLRVEVDVPCEADRLERDITEVLYRVTQEALANVARHARAQSAVVRVALVPDRVTLDIEDDGAGLDATQSERGGRYGIVGMRERVEGVGGTLAIAPRTGARGTWLHAIIPLQERPRG
jgi:signal transduction histidine kinase